MEMSTGSKVALAVAGGLGVAAIFAAASGASAQEASAACEDSPQTAATYTTQAQLRAWVLCVGRSASEANALSVALTGAGRSADAAYVRSCWAQRAQLQAAPPDGSLTDTGKAQADSAYRSPPAAPPADPLPDPGRAGGGRGGKTPPTPLRRLPGRSGVPEAAPSGKGGGGATAAPRRLPGRASPDAAPGGVEPTRSRGGSRLAERVAAPPAPVEDDAETPAAPSSPASSDAARASHRRLPGRRHGHAAHTESTGTVTHGPELPRDLPHGRDPSDADVAATRHPHGHVVMPGDAEAEAEGVRVERVAGELGHDGDDTVLRIGATVIRVTDPTAARRQAGPLAKMMRKATRGQHVTNIRAFQKAAGLDLTGHYDGRVVNALRYYGINDPPSELYEPKASDPAATYKPQG